MIVSNHTPYTQSNFLRLICATIILLLSGCGGCNSNDSALQEQTHNDEHPVEELATMWSRASKNLDVVDAISVPQKDLSYKADFSCASAYDYDARTSISQIYPSTQFSPRIQQVVGRFEMHLEEPKTISIRNRAAGRYQIRNNQRSRGQEYWPGQLPNIQLENRGNQLVKTGNEAALWNSFGYFRGLAYFFPTLPNTGQPHNQASWQADLRTATDQSPAQATTAPFNEINATVKVIQWISVDGEPAVLLEARQTISEIIVPSALGDATEQQRWSGSFLGRYIVLHTGRLLHAALSQKATIRNYQRSADGMSLTSELHQHTLAEARLTGSCSDPKLLPFQRSPEYAQEAINTYMKLIHDLKADNYDRIRHYFSTDLLDAHGEKTIIQLLQKHIERYGSDVFGGPTLAESVQADDQLLSFQTTGRATNFDRKKKGSLTVMTRLILEVINGDIKILSIRTSSSQSQNNADVLEISSERLFSRP